MLWLLKIFSSRRPSRSADYPAEIAAHEGRVLVLEHVGLDVAECRFGFAFDAVVEGLDDVFLEVVAAWMRLDHGISLGIAVLGIAQAEHIHLDAGRDQSYHRVHVLRNTRCG